LVIAKEKVPVRDSHPAWAPGTSSAHSTCPNCAHYQAAISKLKAELEATQAEVGGLRDELGKQASLADTWHVTRSELEVRVAALAGENAKQVHAAVVELESHKTRALRAERERDSAVFQLQEVERRMRTERDEEQGVRETLASHAHDLERRANLVELQRGRAEAEASSARQQLEHWRSATRLAQDEVASLRGEVEALREARGGASAQRSAPVRFAAAPAFAVTKEPEPSVADVQPPKVDLAALQDRLRLLDAESKRLTEELDDTGPARNRTLQARLQREQVRRRIDEVNRMQEELRKTLAG
jgi:hypothetical protein